MQVSPSGKQAAPQSAPAEWVHLQDAGPKTVPAAPDAKAEEAPQEGNGKALESAPDALQGAKPQGHEMVWAAEGPGAEAARGRLRDVQICPVALQGVASGPLSRHTCHQQLASDCVPDGINCRCMSHCQAYAACRDGILSLFGVPHKDEACWQAAAMSCLHSTSRLLCMLSWANWRSGQIMSASAAHTGLHLRAPQ